MPEYRCDMCGQTSADFMVTMIVTGDTVAIGSECVSAWAEVITKALDDAAARETASAAPPAAGWPDPPDMAVIPPTDAAEADSGPVEPDDSTWEADYPQGRAGGPEAAAETGAESESESGSVGAAADVEG